MPIGVHAPELMVLAVLCGGTIALVVGAVAIFRLLTRDTIRQEVRRALDEMRATIRADRGREAAD